METDYREYKTMNKLFSTLFTLGVFLLIGEYNETNLELNSIDNIRSFLGNMLKYVLLWFIIYMFIEGIFVSEKKFILRNLLILFIVNVLIYSVIFFTSPNVTFNQFFQPEAIKYFIGYFSFSIAASFVNTSIFNDYRISLSKSQKPEKVIQKYFLKSVFVTLGLYALFVIFVNQLLQKKIFYDQAINYLLVAIITVFFLFLFFLIDKKKNTLERKIIIESTKAETATAQFETLKNQLDPHFLFNS